MTDLHADTTSNPVRLIRQPVENGHQVEEVLRTFSERPRRIHPKYFYDEVGSRLFEKITELEEYYPTRTECQIYRQHGADMARACGTGRTVIEPGAGSCEKIRLLLDALSPAAYIPMDISGDFLLQSASQLAREFDWLEVTAVEADFCQGMSLPASVSGQRRTLFYPGSTLGNFTRKQAVQFLRQAGELVGASGNILVGLDMHKNRQVLHDAYNDRQGITARFNLNAMAHLNQAFDAGFDLDGFCHEAIYNEDEQRIEMYLRARRDQACELAGQRFAIQEGERILTEYSHKFTDQRVGQMAAEAGLKVESSWFDERGWFGVFLLAPTASAH